MLNKQSIIKIRKIIEKRGPVVVISHVNPDGDALGSGLALALFLKKFDLPVSVIMPNNVPEFLSWLPGFEMVLTYKKKKKQCKALLAEAKTIFLLDFNDPERIGDMKDELKASDAFVIMIDHHQNPVQFTDLLISEDWRGSVGEMIHLLIKDVAGADSVDKDIATCLYVAIMTDTGNFRYASSYPEIFNIVGELVGTGIDKDQIYTNIYDSYSENRMKMMGYCMSEKLVVLREYNTAYISLKQEELDRFDHQIGDTEGFVNIPFSIKGIKVSALFIEKKKHVKISLRSKGAFSVDKLASQSFNGGGHHNAAGGEMPLSLEETIIKFESVLAAYKDELR
ncbi:MAG: DHH family phosphoesterase [Bacteroidales bacterium]